MAVLSHQELKELIAAAPPLLDDYVDLDTQLQPNGFDMSLAAIAAFGGAGHIGFSSADRALPATTELAFDSDDRVHLTPGPYLITLREVVRLPSDVMAIAKPRSSLLRSGVSVHNAVWDAGYHGRSQALMVVYNTQGFTVARNARVVQMVFLRLSEQTASPYAGRYQGEHVDQ